MLCRAFPCVDMCTYAITQMKVLSAPDASEYGRVWGGQWQILPVTFAAQYALGQLASYPSAAQLADVIDNRSDLISDEMRDDGVTIDVIYLQSNKRLAWKDTNVEDAFSFYSDQPPMTPQQRLAYYAKQLEYYVKDDAEKGIGEESENGAPAARKRLRVDAVETKSAKKRRTRQGLTMVRTQTGAPPPVVADTPSHTNTPTR